LTLTVIGYGDPVSMPDLETYKVDYWYLYLCMLSGFLVYQQSNALLSNFLKQLHENNLTITTQSAKVEI